MLNPMANSLKTMVSQPRTAAIFTRLLSSQASIVPGVIGSDRCIYLLAARNTARSTAPWKYGMGLPLSENLSVAETRIKALNQQTFNTRFFDYAMEEDQRLMPRYEGKEGDTLVSIDKRRIYSDEEREVLTADLNTKASALWNTPNLSKILQFNEKKYYSDSERENLAQIVNDALARFDSFTPSQALTLDLASTRKSNADFSAAARVFISYPKHSEFQWQPFNPLSSKHHALIGTPTRSPLELDEQYAEERIFAENTAKSLRNEQQLSTVGAAGLGALTFANLITQGNPQHLLLGTMILTENARRCGTKASFKSVRDGDFLPTSLFNLARLSKESIKDACNLHDEGRIAAPNIYKKV